MKLQIHQNSLLTRKVFFQHNFKHWSSSLYRLDHLVIFIFKSSLSSSSSSHLLSHLLLQVFFITGSGSSWLQDHHCWIIITVSSSNLDHHLIWIIIKSDHRHIWIIIKFGSSSSVLSLNSSHHRKFYRASLFSCYL